MLTRCDGHHSEQCSESQLIPRANFNIGTIRYLNAMEGQAHIRISWRKLICIVGALLVMGAPVSASLCAVGDCSGQSSKADARCSGMAMPRSASSMKAESRVDCCQLNQGLPATFRQSTDTEKAKAEFSPVPLGMGLPSAVATRNRIARPVDSSPRHDVQSLFCTLLL
jgi:hypothetical protein